MKMWMERQSNTQKIWAALRPAQTKALTAAAYPVYNEVKRQLRHGSPSSLGNWGDFVTGNNSNHVTISPIQYNPDGALIKVGTDLLYPLFWELGHHNIFTRHFERDEKWKPAYEATRQQAFDAYARVFKRSWAEGAGLA